MSLALIIILLASAGAAAVVSGAAGFGGALVLLPILIYAVGPAPAVALLTLAQIMGNASRLFWGWRDVRWPAAAWFLATAVPMALAGALLNVHADPRVLRQGIAILLLVVVIGRRRGWLDRPWPVSALGAGGAATGFMSGLAGSAGPLGAAVFLSLRLSPTAYVATEAVTALGMHLVKLIVYGRTLDLSGAHWLLGAGMGGAMFAGTWVGRRLILRLPASRFALLVDSCLIVGAGSLWLS